MSAVDAIEESVEDVTGSVCSHALRAEIESTIVSTWHEHTERLEGIVQQKATSRGEVSTASVWSDLHLRAAARICKSIEDATAANVVDTIGVSTAREVNRVL